MLYFGFGVNRLSFFAYFSSSFYLELDDIFFLREIIISNFGELDRLNLPCLIIQILQFFLQRFIIFLIKIKLIELRLLELCIKILVEMIRLKQPPN